VLSPLPKLLGVKPAPPSVDGAGAGALGHGMDMAITVLVFLGLGALLDRWLGTKPLFMIIFVVLALVGRFVKIWFDYDAVMKSQEARLRSRGSSPS
jgi:F0F1-type ATP synthase assembly protein I